MQNEIHRHELAFLKLEPPEMAQSCYIQMIQDESSNHRNTVDS